MSAFVATVYDAVIAPAELLGLRRLRRELVAPLRGRILELGAGTGKNLPHYSAEVDELVLLEPDPHMRLRLRRKLHPTAIESRVSFSDAPAERLPFEQGSFDHVVITLVLCSVEDVTACLTEAYRVLASGGRLSLIEHIAAPLGSARRAWQTRLDPYWSKLAVGCHLDRDPREELRRLGFRPEREFVDTFPGVPDFLRPLLRGVWVKP
jgi:ubiquinone/menaquinone biosynthesis C-methylase UbiE